MKIEKNKDLSLLNTFGIKAKAAEYCKISSEEELHELMLTHNQRPRLVLGGGSNIILPDYFDGLVIKNEILGIQVIKNFQYNVRVEVGAGVNWHEFVQWTLKNNYGGLENLSLIPGTVGGAVVQNIGAYGVELKNACLRLTAYDCLKNKVVNFPHTHCDFGYRTSFFKKDPTDRYIIMSAVFNLTSDFHRLHTEYGDIQKVLKEKGVTSFPTIQQIGEAVMAIRTSKLPDPAKIPNVGSFFKNVYLSTARLEQLQTQFPDIPYFQVSKREVKIPSAWLIEQCGWKGKKVGNVGCYEKHALVLVNHGGATSTEVNDFAIQITKSVLQKFGLELEPEVTIF